MAIAMLFNPPQTLYTIDTYHKFRERLEAHDIDFPGDGHLHHTCAVGEDGTVTIFDIFQSDEVINDLVDVHAPVYKELNLNLDKLAEYATYLDVVESASFASTIEIDEEIAYDDPPVRHPAE